MMTPISLQSVVSSESEFLLCTQRLAMIQRTLAMIQRTFMHSVMSVFSGLKCHFACLTCSGFTLCMLGNFNLLTFFQNSLINSKKFFQEPLSECQMVWFQIRTDILSVLIWIQTFCKGYQQMTSSC